MNDARYILPITEITSSYEELKTEYAKYGHRFVFDDTKPTAVSDLSKGLRNVIVGEPGIGKTELLKRIKDELGKSGFDTKLILLRSNNPAKQISSFLVKRSKKPKALLLDAFDEVQLNDFSSVVQKINEISEKYPNLTIYVSSRWVFMERYANVFSGYRFIAIKPFTSQQIKDYLASGGLGNTDIENLARNLSQFHDGAIIQIPRYLSLFEEFIRGKSLNHIKEISRNELFEHFIYAKLRIESERNLKIREMEPAIKRLLEKLALTMEIYQSNTITRDELVTFFDNVKSDLKIIVMTQVGIDILLKNSVLQISKENTDRVEFENTEFQEYLAAKEITRLPEPRRAVFSFAADPAMREIYPNWYNTLSFLVDMDSNLLSQLLDYSGVRAETYRIVDESFFAFLSRVNPNFALPETRKRLFVDALSYHNRKLQWLPGQLVSALPVFYTSDLENFLKEEICRAEPNLPTSAKYFVPLGNVAYMIAYLLRSKIQIDKPYWRPRLMGYASTPSENGVLPRHALLALSEFGDPSIINDLPDLTGARDELISREYVSTCAALDPNNPKSVDAFVKDVCQRDIQGRYGLFEVSEPAALKRFLRAYSSEEVFRKEFLEDSSIFEDSDNKIVEHIRAAADQEMCDLVLDALVKSFNYSVLYTRGKSSFVTGLLSFLRQRDPGLIPVLIKKVRESEHGETGLYFSQEFFAEVLQPEDVSTYIDAMHAAGTQDNVIMNTMLQIKRKNTPPTEAVYEAGRVKIPDVYKQYEDQRLRTEVDHARVHQEQLLAEFRNALEPTPGKYMTRVFHDYNLNKQKLEALMTDEDRLRFDTLIRQEALRHDPAAHGLTINSETDEGRSRNYTTSGAAVIFGEALRAAYGRKIDINPYRLNIVRYIPFAHNEELKTVFGLIPSLTPDEVSSLMTIYNDRTNDLWRWQPDCLIAASKEYNLVSAVPILRSFVQESRFRKYDRIEALVVAESLESDSAFLGQTFSRFKESTNEEREIAIAANGLLVSKHSDEAAVKWRLDQLKARVQENTPRARSGVILDITDFDHELNFGKEFAKPLTLLKRKGFEETFLSLLDRALEVWAMGERYHSYASYLWDIVYSYFENLKEYGDYKPLRVLEDKIASFGTKNEGANWLAARMVEIRRSYIGTIGKPPTFSEAIRKYNAAREYEDKRIITSADLHKHIQDVLDSDLRSWIEGEGAYELIVTGKIFKAKKQEYEVLIQKTLKSQIENSMLKRGFQVNILREPQLYDGKRIDLLIRYGFVGPIVLEVKLSSNSDIRARDVTSSKSYKSMERYMQGYGASNGIFLLIINKEIKQLNKVMDAFAQIKGVIPISIDCAKSSIKKKRNSRAKRSVGARNARRRRR